MSFAFAGTPDFGARVLSHLCEIGRVPSLVLSQPDRPKGRGRKSCPPEVVAEAEAREVCCLQVADINSDEALLALADSGVDTLVVASFGQILRPVLLERFRCINVHASLLPRYRGAAPIERAIMAGECQTGVCIMKMVEGLDEGPWAVRRAVTIGRRDDAGSIGRSLAMLGANGVDQVLTGLADGNVEWTEQDGEASYAAKLGSEDTTFDVTLPAKALHDRVRALSPATGTRAAVGDLSLKIWRTWPFDASSAQPLPGEAQRVAGRRGMLVATPGRLFVGCADGLLEMLLVQPAGKGRMPVADFLRGYGSRLGDRVDIVSPGLQPPAPSAD